MVTTAVYGARGYLGRGLLRLLLGHPDTESVAAVSTSAAGDPVSAHIPAFRGTDLRFAAEDDPAAQDADVVFLATSDAEAARLLASWGDDAPRTVIDLSRHHRLGALGGSGWSYGLADLWPVPEGTARIANPGCYPTATLLAAGPALQAGLAAPGPLIADGKSGASGAGATPRPDLHYPEANESVRAYKVLGHDHGFEIQAATGRFEGTPRPVRFTPHLVPQTRGLLATVYVLLQDGVDTETVREAYQAAYAEAPFVRLVAEPDTAHVSGSNRADVAVDVDPATGLLVARCAIDNLVKGGSGQAVQNMNHALGLPAATGLSAIGGAL